MRALHKVSLVTGFNDSFFYKDCSIEFLAKRLDAKLINELRDISTLLTGKPYITFDVGFLKMKEGDKTCRNTGWHVDGFNNDYLIYCQGDFRTQFLTSKAVLPYPAARAELRAFNESISCKDFDVAGVQEIPDSTLVKYTSQDVHKGRVATTAGERFFLRVCSSDYLYPRNIILR